MLLKDDFKRFFKKKNPKPLLGSIIGPYREIPYTPENVMCMRMYCTNVRNFKNTSLRKTISRLEYLKFSYVEDFKLFWFKLKMISLILPHLKPTCYELLRNGFDIAYMKTYQDALERCTEKSKEIEEMIGYQSNDPDFEQIDNICSMLRSVPMEHWIPLTVFPRYEYKKEGKMHLAFVEKNYEDKIEEFRYLTRLYLRELDIKTLFVPSPEIVLKVDSSRYNDGGVIRRDYEKPLIDFECGFLYQSFNPKPLGTREVWVPDRSTKICNTFWQVIGRQIVTSDPRYPDVDPEITYGKIKHKLDSCGLFDISGFGFQYPREYVVVVAEEISKLFSNPDIFEFVDILKLLFKKIKVQMPDGTYQYPIRGTGLGYFEDLKTIGMLAILNKYNVISLYGDQGLIHSNEIHHAMERLRNFGFIVPEDKYQYQIFRVKWSGWLMSTSECVRPKSLLEPVISAFEASYHWERKAILRNFYNEFPEFYDSIDGYITFQYELAYGYEFYRGDSLMNFSNCGVSSRTPVHSGQLRTWQVQNMYTPRDNIVDSVAYETPFFVEWKRAQAKQFSIKRKEVYKNSLPCSTELYYYVNPKIVLHKSKKPSIPRIASFISDAVESRLLVNYGLSTGKFTWGLSGQRMVDALKYCSRARNPFEAYATGGYQVETVWRAPVLVSWEYLELLEKLLTSTDMMHSHMVNRLDVYDFDYTTLFPHLQKRKSPADDDHEVDHNEGVHTVKSRYTKLNISDMVNLTDVGMPDTADPGTLMPVSDIIGDMNTRSLNLVDTSEDVLVEDLDDDFFLEEFQETESEVEEVPPEGITFDSDW
nr:putative RNA-dependent RNA polymerase [Erysiphe lesion-associated ormycovirus 4]